MIYPSKYNGINFSNDFNRSSGKYNYDLQRRKGILLKQNFKYLSFEVDYVEGDDDSYLKIHGQNGITTIQNTGITNIGTKAQFYFEILQSNLTENDFVYFSFTYHNQTIFSDFYDVKAANSDYCYITSSNADNRHGYLTNQAFGFFAISKLKSDIFLNKKVEYNYSYSRKKILSSENQIGKRYTFLDLTMYQANLLKWLCNCESVSIDGVQMQLISEFTEIEADNNSEILCLQADFVEVNQSFFATASTERPKNIFVNEFFN